MKFYLVLAALPLALATPTLAKDQTSDSKTASTPSQTDDSGAKADKPEKEKKICHRELITGSITPRRVCRTVSEIETEKSQGDSSLEEMQRQARVQRPEH